MLKNVRLLKTVPFLVLAVVFLTGAGIGTIRVPETGERYVILQELGHGGVGQVYAVQRILPDGTSAQWAVKIFNSSDNVNPHFSALAAQIPAGGMLLPFTAPVWANVTMEAEAISQLQRVMFMPRAGPSLGTLISTGEWQSSGGISSPIIGLERTLRFAQQGFEALRELGRLGGNGWVHRDIKPENFLLLGSLEEFDSGRARFVLADFDLARPLSSDPASDPSFGLIVGTLGFLSPEQSRRSPTTTASDYFSFGPTVHQTLFRSSPILRLIDGMPSISQVHQFTSDLSQPTPDGERARMGLRNLIDFEFEKLRNTLGPTQEKNITYLENIIRDLLNPTNLQVRVAAGDIPNPISGSSTPRGQARPICIQSLLGLSIPDEANLPTHVVVPAR